MTSKPYPAELDGLVKSTVYKPEPWRVKAGGGVMLKFCRAQVARPRKSAVTNQCGHLATKWLGEYGFCTLHANQILHVYKVSAVLSDASDEPFLVQY